MAQRHRKPRFRPRLKSLVVAIFRDGHWHEDFRRIGNWLFIAGIATPALSNHGSFLSGPIIAMVGIVLMVVAKTQEA